MNSGLINLQFCLPFPPSVNGYWRAIVRGKRPAQILSERGRRYKQDVKLTVGRQAKPLTGRLSVAIELWPPTRARRDLDNYPKAINDALTDAGVWLDDSQIDELTITRCDVRKGGMAIVTITEAL